MKLKHLLLLLTTVVSFSATRAADGSDFTFNDGVRYSQWVINSRLNSFSANTAKMGFATFNADGTQISERNDGGKKKLDYVPGLVAKGVIEATQYYSQFTWAAPWTKPWFLSVADYGDKWYNVSTAGGSLDDLNGVKLYFALRELAKTDGVYPKSDTYDNAGTAIGKAITGLGNHNTYYSIKAGSLAGDDVVGGWFHKEKYNNQMWLDGQYMGPALLAQIINYKNAKNNVSTDDWKLIIKQLDAVWKMCWNSTDKLLYHGFEAYGGTGTDDNATKSLAGTWAGLNASTLHSESYWGRACGWYFLALVDILHEMDKANLSTNDTYKADYTRIKGYLDELAAGLKARQDATGENATYGWYQILDKNGTYHASVYNNGQTHTDTYNYIESSATAIFAAAYIKAIRLGYLSESTYGETAKKAYQCIVNNFFAADGKDGVHIFGSCRSAGLGSDKTDGTGVEGGKNFRDGSNAYYLLGSDVAKVEKSEKVTEGKVLGAFILAATEYEQLYQTDKLLFEKDLAPTYTLKSDKPSITLNAYGVDGVTYQWYKDGGGAVTDATSATFTPTESGKYYCTATANGKTITSSTTDVTVTATDGVDNNTGDVKFSLSNITAKSGTVNQNTDYTIPSTGASITGGSVSVHNGKSSGVEMVANNAINISGSGRSYLCVTLYNNLAVGDVITLDKSGTMYVGNSTTKPGSSKTLPYTITEGDGLAGQNKLYLWKDGISSIKSLTITTASTTCTVTTSATNGSIAVVDGSGNTVTNLSSVAKGTKLVFTATANPGYKFDAWNVVGTQGTASGTTYTISSLDQATTVTASFVKDSSTGNDGDICDFNGGGSSQTWAKLITGKVQELTSAVRYKDKDYSRGVKFESSTEIEITLSEPKTVNFVFAKTSKSTAAIKINEGSGMTLEDKGDYYLVTVSLEAGKYSVKKAGSGESYLAAIELITLSASDLHILGTVEGESKTNYVNNSNTWTPAAGGTIALSDLVKSSSTGAYTITSGNDVATLDGTTLTAQKGGTITLTQAADGEYASGSVDINIAIGSNVAKNGTNAYTVEKDKVYSDGLTVTREDITMTFGNDGFWRKVTDGNLWTQGQTNPNPADGKIPTSGTYYKFRPTKNGTLKATVYIGKTDDGKLRPLYVSENGTAIEATAGSDTVGKGETPAATVAYQGDVTFPVKANTDYYVYVNGSKMRLLGFEFDPVVSSDNTATFSRGVLNGETLTVTHHKSEANSAQTITVTPAIGATCTSVSGPATLSGNTLSYTAPGAGASLANITLTVTAENDATKTYTINVSTVGDVTIGNAIFSLDELRRFGTRSGKGEVTVLSKENVTLTATENGVIEGGQTGTNGTKVKSGAGFTITPNNGVRITKITIVTDNTGRWFTATPTQEGEMKRTDKTYEYSFNSIDQAVTFMNNSGNNLYANRIIVEYENSVGTGKTILAASFDKNELSFYEDDTEISALPVLSVKIGDEVADAGLYTVTYTSSNPNVVAVDTNGKLTKVGAGSAVINAAITPKDVNTYVGSEAFYTVTVKPLDIPTVYAHDITVYNTAGMQPEPVVDVYVKDEAGRSISLPKDYYTLAYTQQSGDAILISDKTGKFILAGEAGNWTTGSAVVRVEFNPTDDARQQYHITDTYVDFNVHVLNAGDKFIPAIGGVSEARIQISDNTSERSFVTPVLYDGVDLSTGFTFKYTLRDNTNTGSKFQNAASDGSVTSKGDGYVTLLSGKTAGTVYIDITATPDENYKSLYNEVTKAIQVTVANLKCYNSVTITPSSITAKVGDVLQGFDIVVRDENDNIVSEDDYTMFWGSSAPGVVAIAGDRGAGVFKTMAAGQAIVRVFVTDKDGKYSDRKGECTVTVIDDGTFKVTPEKIAELTGDKYDSSQENYGITASKLKGLELSVSDGLSVVLGGWMFPNSVKGSHGTTTETLGVDQWGAPTSKYRKPLGFTHSIQMGDQKNARQEYGSNCQPESNCIYDKTLTEVNDGFKLMDPMFNVPCSGSYLAFYPKTTGTVTVYIRQNGVFDNQTKNGVTTCVYRPQRRVFVIDEMGNFVSSTPKLEYPTTWQDNGLDPDGTKYTCDILGNSSEATKIYDLAKKDVTITGDTDKEKVQNWVKNHFEGLKTFDIDPEMFQNGVYASNLANEITHNNAQRNHSGDRAAKGWCVLTAAPVSYKFNVKAGKTYYLYNFGSKLGLFGFTFRPTDFVVDEKTWYQTSETNSPEKTPDNHVAKVSIPDRTFPAGIWSACVLPFSMNRIQVNNVFGDCYDKNNLKGTQILYFDRVEGHKIYFRRHAYNTIVAGKPFLIKPTKEAVISSENMGTKFPYVTIEAETPQAEWGRTAGNTGGIGSIDTDYTWVSSYGSMTALPGDYYLNGNGDVSHCTEGHQIPIKGFRGYLKAKTKQAASKVLKLAYDSNVDGDGEATPIEGLVMDREGNLLEVPTSGVVYNLSGQVVTRDADKLYTLPAGIYIVNGKKYIVR